MLLLIRICHPQSPPAFVRLYDGGVIGLVHDAKQATCYDDEERAQVIVDKITSAGQVEVVDRGAALR